MHEERGRGGRKAMSEEETIGSGIYFQDFNRLQAFTQKKAFHVARDDVKMMEKKVSAIL
jgi:hypothetical protein